MLLGAFILMGGMEAGFGGSLPGKVEVITRRNGDTTRFFLKNAEAIDMTATLEIATENMKSSERLPRTITVPAGKTVEALTLTPLSRDWSFKYTNHYTLGVHQAAHDDTCHYALPYAAGAAFKVTQGYHGAFSHTGRDEYALDWKMPEGTPVLAARDGVVVSVKDGSTQGGPDRKFEDFANLVVVQHADGTMAHYCHLAPHSAKVTAGQSVKAGDLLAASGNTGFTSGPHLHFAVFRARDGYGRETIPVTFRTADDVEVKLVSGKSYRAANVGGPARD